MRNNDVSQAEIDRCKKRIIEILFKQPAEPKDLYAVMNPAAAYEALLSLTFEGKVRSENLTYFPSMPNQNVVSKPVANIPVDHGKPVEHKIRAGRYTGELTDPN